MTDAQHDHEILIRVQAQQQQTAVQLAQVLAELAALRFEIQQVLGRAA